MKIEYSDILRAEEQSIDALLPELNIAGVLYAQIHRMMLDDEASETLEDSSDDLDHFSDKTLVLALAQSMRRLSYHLYYLMRHRGQEVNELDLQVLGEAVKEVCSENFDVEDVEGLLEWDYFLRLCFFELHFFKSSREEKIGEDYLHALALNKVLAESQEGEVRMEIVQFIDQVKTSVKEAMLPAPLNVDVLDMVKTVSELGESRFEALHDMEIFYNFLFTEIERVCDEQYMDEEEILKAEESLRKIVPQLLADYSSLIGARIAFFLQKLVVPMSFKIVMPDVHSIWQALLDIYFHQLKESLDSPVNSVELTADSIQMFGGGGSKGLA